MRVWEYESMDYLYFFCKSDCLKTITEIDPFES